MDGRWTNGHVLTGGPHDGIGAIAGILKAASGARILMHSAFTDHRGRAPGSGAHGWAGKGRGWDEIRGLIADLLAGSEAV